MMYHSFAVKSSNQTTKNRFRQSPVHLQIQVLTDFLLYLLNTVQLWVPVLARIDREHTERNKAQAVWAKRKSSAYIGVKEVKGHVPGTTRNGGRTKNAINNFQASGYVRAPEGVAQFTEAPNQSPEVPNRSPEVPKRGASRWRHTVK